MTGFTVSSFIVSTLGTISTGTSFVVVFSTATFCSTVGTTFSTTGSEVTTD